MVKPVTTAEECDRVLAMSGGNVWLIAALLTSAVFAACAPRLIESAEDKAERVAVQLVTDRLGGPAVVVQFSGVDTVDRHGFAYVCGTVQTIPAAPDHPVERRFMVAGDATWIEGEEPGNFSRVWRETCVRGVDK